MTPCSRLHQKFLILGWAPANCIMYWWFNRLQKSLNQLNFILFHIFHFLYILYTIPNKIANVKFQSILVLWDSISKWIKRYLAAQLLVQKKISFPSLSNRVLNLEKKIFNRYFFQMVWTYISCSDVFYWLLIYN